MAPSQTTKLCILQSYDEKRMTPWLRVCQDSVQDWAQQRGYAYQFIGDELFDDVPTWYMDKVQDRLPIAADLGRLQWISRLLQDYEQVVWMDIDVLVFAPNELAVQFYDRDCVFGQECWLQHDKRTSKLTTIHSVHNAYMGFVRASVTLPFLTDTVTRLMQRVDADHIAPQFVGPKLLSSLNNTVGFALEPAVSAFSQTFREALLADEQAVLAIAGRRVKGSIAAANLCSSLAVEDQVMLDYVEQLRSFPEGISAHTFVN